MLKQIFKTTAITATFLVLVSFVFNACSKHHPDIEPRKSQKQKTVFLFPQGTEFEISENSDEMSFSLPFGYQYIELTDDESYIYNGGSIRCDCSSGDGACVPFAGGGYIGCVTEGCSTCIGTTSGGSESAREISLEFIKLLLLTYSDSVLFALSGLSHLKGIGSAEEWFALPFISESFYEEVEDEIIEALESVWEKPINEIRLSENSVYVPISIYDQKLLLAMPIDNVDAGLMYTLRAAMNFNSSGSCSGCEGSCHYKSVKLGAFVFCDGCDSGCTLHTKK